MNTLYYILGAVALLVFWLILTFNRLVSLRNRVKEAYSDIDVQLKRRYNLIPNLMETVKGYAKHESEVFQKVTEARTKAMGAQGAHDKGEAENMLSNTLKSLFAVAESYPDLKASTSFVELQRELRDTEDKIQASRRFYNTNVMKVNTTIQSFPVNFISGVIGFKTEEFFEAEENVRDLPKVSC